MRYLNNRIDLSTITVNLQEPEPVGGETGHSFIAAINNGIAGFFGMIDAIIVILFTLLPLIIIGVVAYGVYRWKKGKKAATTAPAPQQQQKNS
jgi:lipoprotein signal peptidase